VIVFFCFKLLVLFMLADLAEKSKIIISKYGMLHKVYLTSGYYFISNFEERVLIRMCLLSTITWLQEL